MKCYILREMEAENSLETLVAIYQPTRRHNPARSSPQYTASGICTGAGHRHIMIYIFTVITRKLLDSIYKYVR